MTMIFWHISTIKSGCKFPKNAKECIYPATFKNKVNTRIQLSFNCSNSAIKILEEVVKYVQS